MGVWGAFYGAAVLVAVALSCFSNRRVIFLTGLGLLVGWALSNLTVALYDGPLDVWPFAAIDFAFGTAMLLVYMHRPAPWSAVIAAASMAQLGLHGLFWADYVRGADYFIANNLLFLTQTLAVVAISAWRIGERIGRAQARRARERAAIKAAPLQDFPRWGGFPLS